MITPKTVTSIQDLITKTIEDWNSWKTETFPWFRGEPSNPDTPLLPKLYRHRPGEKTHSENRLLQQFRMKAPSLGLMKTPPRNHTDEWLFLAQHVGLPTRLLDWTEGLLVALYFALKEKEPAIWMLDPIELNRRASGLPMNDNEYTLPWFSLDAAPVKIRDLITILRHVENESTEKDNEFFKINLGNINIRAAWELDKVGLELPFAIHPTNIHIRMNTQKSCFTVHGKRKISISHLVDSRVLRKYIIPQDKDILDSMKKYLRMIGFTHTSVFPDLDNLAKDLSEIF
jgi:hypothetical protein